MAQRQRVLVYPLKSYHIFYAVYPEDLPPELIDQVWIDEPLIFLSLKEIHQHRLIPNGLPQPLKD